MQRYRVLVVEDSEVTRAILVRVLRQAGFEVLEARDGAEAALIALREVPSVVVTDLEMPILDGFPLLRLLKSEPSTAHVPVLILTSHGEAASRFWSLHTGADGYLTKNDLPDRLVETVERLAAAAAPPAARPLGPLEGAEIGPLDILARVARQLDAGLLQATLVNTLLEQGVAASDFHEAARAALETLGEILDTALIAVAVADPEVVLSQTHLTQAVRHEEVEEFGRRLIERLHPRPGLTLEARVSGARGDLPLPSSGTIWLPLPLRGASGVLAVDLEVHSHARTESTEAPAARLDDLDLHCHAGDRCRHRTAPHIG